MGEGCMHLLWSDQSIFGNSLNFSVIHRLHTVNEGRTAIGNLTGFIPCTPHGCIELIKRSGIPLVGAKAVVLGW